MDLHRYPGLVDRLAAEYALGTLRGPALRRLRALAERDAVIRRALLEWQHRLAALPELLPAVAPPASLWQALHERLIAQERRANGLTATLPERRRDHRIAEIARARVPKFWRAWAMAATACAVVAFGWGVWSALPQRAVPDRLMVAVLADASSHAGMVATWSEQRGVLILKRVADDPAHGDRVLQLWALLKQGTPVSLGVLARGQEIVLPMKQAPDFPAMAISVEAPGGSANPHGPTGPVVWSGPILAAT